MNILYISHLSTNIAAGLNWSVPASVDAQSMLDNVLWVNMTDVVMEHWTKVKAYHNIREFDDKFETIECLPPPHNFPDVVIFEGFYYIEDVKISKMLRRYHIPYIIIPRGSLTRQALHNHAWFKKMCAHWLYFDSYVKNATAIQYLTQKEADDSTRRFKTPYFIVPNGFNPPQRGKESFTRNGIVASFIGRLDMYHKGIDLLLEAIVDIQDELSEANFSLTIYGPRRYDFYKIEKEIAKRGLSDVVKIHDEICGKEKELILLNSDLFVMTSRFEGHPMGLIEAMAYGIPCIVTPGTNMAKEVKETDAGWVCEERIESIRKVLLEVVNNRESLSLKGKGAFALSKRYRWPDLAQKSHNELLNVINK